MPGSWVFAGGTMRADDLGPEASTLAPQFSPHQARQLLDRPPDVAPSPNQSLAYLIAAARELFEEAGVLLTNCGALHQGARHLHSVRDSLERGRPFPEVAAELGIELALDQLIYYAHWITPESIPQRYDTRFFIAMMPADQKASPSLSEMSDGRWLTAREALAARSNGEMPMHFSTASHVRRLARWATLGELLEFARTKPVLTVLPPTRKVESQTVPYLPPEIDDEW